MPFELLGTDVDEWINFRFDLMDSAGSPVDTVMWDMGLSEDSFAVWTGSGLLPLVNNSGFNRWFESGIDCVERLVSETRNRGIEVIWNHRVCPVDFPMPYIPNCPYDSPLRNNYLKKQHPDWVNECWWPHGLWNLASEGLRQHKLKYFSELMNRYDFDGLQLDFARHTPCLPPGREWENREHATAFVRETRRLLDRLEKERNKTLVLGVRVAENIAGCHAEGFEIEKWIGEGLVDLVLLGGRTSVISIHEFKSLCSGRDIKIYPSFDGHHAGDGYFCPSASYLRGVFSNFLLQEADGISLFNWVCARTEKYRNLKLSFGIYSDSLQDIFFECGSLSAMSGKDKTYAVERRGGYPWAGNYFYRNDDKPLPVPLEPNKRVSLPVYIYEKFEHSADVTLDVMILDAGSETQLEARIDSAILEPADRDFNCKDGQIYGGAPQPDSGDFRVYKINPMQKLARFSFAVPAGVLVQGKNTVQVVLQKSGCRVTLEKVEIHISVKISSFFNG